MRYYNAMKILKLILGIVALFFAVWLGFAVVGLVFGLLFYVVVAVSLAGAGYAVYKLFLEKDKPLLNPYSEVSEIEINNMKQVKELEDLKRKYLK
jgi:uncharacterized membrane protein